MSEKPRMPDPEKVKQTVANLRRSRLAMEAATLELEEITAQIEHHTRQQRLARLRRVLSSSDAKSNLSEQNQAKTSS